ncbi:3'-5' exonuclease [Propionivibrio sp.]|uniref:3'-5' exonuclease n=1 Tax=Propionivibrio sp. TaxID=2212460 RepID=UPI003BF1048E
MEPIDFSREPNAEQVALATDWLARGNYRVIRPLPMRTTFSDAPTPEKLITVAILDTETTGTRPGQDKIIELGMVFVEVCPQTGQAYRILEVFDELEDPGMPIPEASTRIHHITDAMVSGKRIDDEQVAALVANVSLVIAHNAGFDRVFVEQRFPIFATKAWACSWAQIPWSEEGVGSSKLEFLAYFYGFHFTGHRAVTDCQALLEVLQQTLPSSDARAMQVLLQNAWESDIKVSALGSPFESKDVLKERDYRWNGDKKVWAKSIPKQRLDEEAAWLKTFVYGGKGFRLELEKITVMNRFSNRPGPIEVVNYD